MQRTIILLAFILFSATAFSCERSFRLPTELTIEQRKTYPWPYIESILKQTGCTITWVNVTGNPSRLLRMLELGEVDILPESSFRTERLSYGFYSKPYRVEKAHLYVLAQDHNPFAIRSIEDIEHGSWIIVDDKSAWLGAPWQQLRGSLQKQGRLISATGPKDAIRLLRSDRAHMIADTDGWGDSLYNHENGIKALPFVLNQENVHFLLNKKSVSRADLEAIDAAIDLLSTAQ